MPGLLFPGKPGFLAHMGKAVLLHRADSIYDDAPDVRYEFPKTYLKAVREAVGDWIVYYEPVKAGPRGYFAVAQVNEVIESPSGNGMWWAMIAPGSYLEFDSFVPRLLHGSPLEMALREPDGTPKKGGAQQLAVRRLPDPEFSQIVNMGLPQDLEASEARRYTVNIDMADRAALFERPVLERLTRRAYRDVAFRRKVRAAYEERCAISGLGLRNGGGRPEVQAAHIRPVEENASDSVRNGLALSATLHWMFDRGLIALDIPDPAAPGDVRVLVSDNKVPRDVADRLIRPDRRLTLPEDRRDWPHPANIQWHRENRFGTGDPSGLFSR
ncbi:HNH endonuclease [Mameliella alba]|uniref:HNH endonuclease n=2 Tax=Mameliella alba TaxID=561184 RepID=UPI00199E9390|nr:HNH endonuclease [Mameliella alba]GGF47928.1 restriction endonuclease [Mameliella alba]